MWVNRHKHEGMVEQIETLARRLSAQQRVETDLQFDLMKATSELNKATVGDYVVGPGGATLYADEQEAYAHQGETIRERVAGWVSIISASGGVVAKLKFEKSFIVEQHEPVVMSDRDPKENDQA